MKAKYIVIYYIDSKRHEFDTFVLRDDKIDEADLYSQIMPKVEEHYKDTYGVNSFAVRKGFSDITFDYLGPS